MRWKIWVPEALLAAVTVTTTRTAAAASAQILHLIPLTPLLPSSRQVPKRCRTCASQR